MTTEAQRRGWAKYKASPNGKVVAARAARKYRASPAGILSNRRQQERRRRMHQAYTGAIRESLGCADCGTHSGRLHFHHRPDEIKLFNVGSMVCSSRKAVDTEMQKCDVLCLACHNRRHDKVALMAQARSTVRA